MNAEMTPSQRKSAIRVVIAGFDPISLLPHGVVLRANSGEGQIDHTTSIFQELTRMPYEEYAVQVVPFPNANDPLKEKAKVKEPFASFRRLPKGPMDQLQDLLKGQAMQSGG